MDGQEVVERELDLLARAFAVLDGLLASDDESVRLQAVKSVIRLLEVVPPAALLASPSERADADRWRSWLASLEGLEDDLTQT